MERTEEKIVMNANGEIYLYLPNCRKPKRIGTLQDKILTVWKREKDIMEKWAAYGFNYKMINDYQFDILRVVEEDGNILETTKFFILAKGFNEIHNPFELQVFLKLEDFGIERARAYEQEQKTRKGKQWKSYTLSDFAKSRKSK